MLAPSILQQGEYYHIFNRGINSAELFVEDENFEYFLQLYDKHISEVADTYAWALMPNHFHFIIRIKTVEENIIPDKKFSNLTGSSSNLAGLEDLSGFKKTHQYFSNLFNAYSKAFNKRFNRHGPMFERPFKRKPIRSEKYLREAICYVHANPVHHGFCQHPIEYPWTSYPVMLDNRPAMVKREEVMKLFGSRDHFLQFHHQKFNSEIYYRWESEI